MTVARSKESLLFNTLRLFEPTGKMVPETEYEEHPKYTSYFCSLSSRSLGSFFLSRTLQAA